MTNRHSSKEKTPFHATGLMPQEEMLEIKSKHKQLIIGLPKDSLDDEGRIALTPLNVELLINNGHKVIIETGAGIEANFQDREYSEHGAEISDNRAEVLKADIILTVSPLSKKDINSLKGNQLLFSAINMISISEEYLRALMAKKVTAIAFEYLKDTNNCFPIVRSMSEIAGSTSVVIAAEYLSNVHSGKGKVLGGVTGVNPSEVVILGAGTAGEFAAKTALGLGALVKIFDTDIYKLRRIQNNLNQTLFTSVVQPKVLRNALRSADVLIGAMRIINQGPGYLVSEEMVKQMKSGSVIVDISIDQGGCVETSEVTKHNNPVVVKHGISHYGVPNIASRVARTASYALSNIFASVFMEMSLSGSINNYIKNNAGVRSGVYIYNGILTNRFIGEKLNMDSRDIDLLTAAF